MREVGGKESQEKHTIKFIKHDLLTSNAHQVWVGFYQVDEASRIMHHELFAAIATSSGVYSLPALSCVAAVLAYGKLGNARLHWICKVCMWKTEHKNRGTCSDMMSGVLFSVSMWKDACCIFITQCIE